jgi:hypothetical protein
MLLPVRTTPASAAARANFSLKLAICVVLVIQKRGLLDRTECRDDVTRRTDIRDDGRFPLHGES